MEQIHRKPLLLALAILTAAALPVSGKRIDPCGDPARISQGYPSYQGTVVRIIDPVTLLVDISKTKAGLQPFPGCTAAGCRAKIRLVNLDAPVQADTVDAAKRALSKATLSRQVNLALSPVQGTPGITNALVYIGTRSINQQQVTGGFATYRVFGPYAVDSYIECKMQRGQAQAEVSGRGVWKKKP
jgi:endonuclease YncB( thermonuclease family)